MADKKKMSVEDILAACRTDKPGDENVAPSPGAKSSGEAAPADQPTPETPAAEDAPPAKKPSEMSVADMLAAARGKGSKPAGEAKPKAEKPAAAAKKPGEMSVADMLAAARAGKGGGAAEKSTSPKPAAKSAPAAKEKPAAAEKGAKPVAAGPLDTQSILSSARKKEKAGPITKAEAAAKGEAVPAAPEKKKVTMPERPAYVAPTPKSKAAAKDETRRGFFSWAFGSSLAIGFSTLTLTGLITSLGMARFMFPNVRTEPPMKFKAGTPADLSPGQVETKYKSQFAVWVVRAEYEGQPQIYALSTVCTHLGCTPNWLEAEQKFKCPCHGSGFYKDGVNFEGPAPRPLERYAIRIADDGQLEIDKSRVYQQELGQWTDPGSFIAPA